MTSAQRDFILRCDRFVMRCRDIIRSAPEYRTLVESWMRDVYKRRITVEGQ